MLKTLRIAAATAITTGLLVSAISPAWSFGVPLDIGNGTISAKGAAVSIPVTFTCELEEGRTTESVQILLQQQLSPKRQARGAGSAEVECTGSSQTVEITAIAFVKNAGFAFRSGDAVATLTIGDPAGEPLTKTIRIGN